MPGRPLTAVEVSAASKTIKVLWRGPSGTNGSPVVGGGAVWVTDYSQSSGGTLYELNQATGQVEQQISISQGAAALFLAVAERRQRLRQHADRHHRDQRRLAGGYAGSAAAGPGWLMFADYPERERVSRPSPFPAWGVGVRERWNHALVRSDADFDLCYGR